MEFKFAHPTNPTKQFLAGLLHGDPILFSHPNSLLADVLLSAHIGQNSRAGLGMIPFRDGSRRGDRSQSSKDCPDSCLTRSVGQQIAR
jgi:hypothetical protein